MTASSLARRLLPALALVLLAAPASQAAAPAPGCAGLAFSDPEGDVPAMAGPTATNLDITEGFFNTDAKGKVFATMKVADMSLAPPPPATAVTWYMTWVVKDVTYYVSLDANLAGETVYETGTYGPGPTGGDSYQPTGETTGTVVEGPGGSITWAVPASAKGSSGQSLTAPAGQTYQLVQNGLGGGVLLFGDETAADEGVTYTVGSCENGGGATTVPGIATPNIVAPGVALPAPTLPLTLATKSVKAKRGVVAVRLKGSAAVTSVVARLRKGNKAFGTGKLAAIAAGKTGALKIKAKKARKGTYVLDVTARLVDGRTASHAFRLRVR